MATTATNTNVNITDIPDALKPYRAAELDAAASLAYNTNSDFFKAHFPLGTYYGGSPASSGSPTVDPNIDPSRGVNPGQQQQAATPPITSLPQATINAPPPLRPTKNIPNANLATRTPMLGGNPVINAPMQAPIDQVSSMMPRIAGLRYDPKLGYVPDSSQSFRQGGRYAAGGPTNALDVQLAKLAAEIQVPGVTLGPGGTPLGGNYDPVQTGGWNIPTSIPTNTTPGPARPAPPPGLFPSGGLLPVSGVPRGTQTPPPTGANPLIPPTGVTPPPSGGTPAPILGGTQPTPIAGAQNAPPGMFSPGAAGTTSSNGQFASDAEAARLARQLGATVSHTNEDGPIAPPPQNTLDFGGAAQNNAGLVQQHMNWAAGDPSKSYLALLQERTSIANNGGDTSGIDKSIALASQAYANQNGGNNATGTGVIGHRHGGVIRRDAGGGLPNALGVGSSAPALSASNPSASNSIFAPYVPYDQQRTLAYSPSFGQVASDGTIQASNLTQSGLAKTGSMPAVYDDKGNINQASPLGNAWNYAQNSADASQHASAMANQFMDQTNDSPGVQSSFGGVMQGIAQDPSRFQAGDINTPTLTAPQLQQPQSVQAMSAADVLGSIGHGPAAAQVNYDPSGINRYQMQGPGTVQAGQTTTGAFGSPDAAHYMNPYLGNVLTQQQQLDQQRYNEQQGTRDAHATAAGAYGGSRQAVADSLAQRDFNQQEALQQANALNTGYNNAEQQYSTDAARSLASQQTNVGANLQGQEANQAAQLATSGQNLNANLATNQLQATTGLSAALANQQAQQQAELARFGTAATVGEQAAAQDFQGQVANQNAGLTAGEANLGAAMGTQQLGVQSGLAAQQSNQATRLDQNKSLLSAAAQADALNQQAYQANTVDRLAANSQASTAASNYNNVGTNFANTANLAQNMDLQQAQAQQQAGQQIDNASTSSLNLGYQDFLNQKNDPYQKMNWLAGIQSGVPFGTTMEGIQFQKPPAGAGLGLGLAAAGMASNASNPNSSGGLYGREGGPVKTKKAGGLVKNPEKPVEMKKKWKAGGGLWVAA